MDKPSLYEIRIDGHLKDRWRDWCEGMVICDEINGEKTLSVSPLEYDASVFLAAHRRRGL